MTTRKETRATEGGLFDVTDVPPRGRAQRRLAWIEPSVTLPAIMRRTGAPEPVSLPEARTEVLAAIGRSGALTVDVETTGYPIGHRHFALRTAQLGDAHAAVVFDARERDQATAITDLLAHAPVLWAHSACADLVPLAHTGLIEGESGWDRMRDTVILAALADRRAPGVTPRSNTSPPRSSGSAPCPRVSRDRARATLFTRGGWLTDTTPTTPLARSGWAQVDAA